MNLNEKLLLKIKGVIVLGNFMLEFEYTFSLCYIMK